MPSNIEIKAILRDRAAAELTASRLSGTAPQTFREIVAEAYVDLLARQKEVVSTAG